MNKNEKTEKYLNKTEKKNNKSNGPNSPNSPKELYFSASSGISHAQWTRSLACHFYNPPSTPFDLCCKTTEKSVWTRRPSIKSATDLKKPLPVWSLRASPCTSCTVFKISHKHLWICQQIINASHVWVLGIFFFKLYALQKCETMKKKVPFNINPLEAKTAE